MAEIQAEITANVWQVVVEEGQMVAEGDEICILESMKMEIPVITEAPGVVRELYVEPEQTVQEGDLIALSTSRNAAGPNARLAAGEGRRCRAPAGHRQRPAVAGDRRFHSRLRPTERRAPASRRSSSR